MKQHRKRRTRRRRRRRRRRRARTRRSIRTRPSSTRRRGATRTARFTSPGRRAIPTPRTPKSRPGRPEFRPAWITRTARRVRTTRPTPRSTLARRAIRTRSNRRSNGAIQQADLGAGGERYQLVDLRDPAAVERHVVGLHVRLGALAGFHPHAGVLGSRERRQLLRILLPASRAADAADLPAEGAERAVPHPQRAFARAGGRRDPTRRDPRTFGLRSSFTAAIASSCRKG